jgi:hypothetical protein
MRLEIWMFPQKPNFYRQWTPELENLLQKAAPWEASRRKREFW